MSDQPKVTGPASYFPSIERKYGQPIEHWFKELDAHKELRHSDMVAYLKTEHGMGHGHANAIVAYYRGMNGM
jgi:hypothetical protein